jgi:hypothetical protein
MGTHWGQPKNLNPNLLKKNHSKEEDCAIVFSACPRAFSFVAWKVMVLKLFVTIFGLG